jgi:phosphatidylserine/phosphatidylglycerophosphate/cardiolipin synthase-like enzyme
MKKFKRLPIVKKLALSWQKALNNMLALGGLSSHNHIHIYHDGDEAFHAIFKAIREAQNSIYVETYIFCAR